LRKRGRKGGERGKGKADLAKGKLRHDRGVLFLYKRDELFKRGTFFEGALELLNKRGEGEDAEVLEERWKKRE